MPWNMACQRRNSYVFTFSLNLKNLTVFSLHFLAISFAIELKPSVVIEFRISIADSHSPKYLFNSPIKSLSSFSSQFFGSKIGIKKSIENFFLILINLFHILILEDWIRNTTFDKKENRIILIKIRPRFTFICLDSHNASITIRIFPLEHQIFRIYT